jgi:recombination protein RecT
MKTQTAQASTMILTQPEAPKPATALAPIDLIRVGLDKMTPNLAVALPKHIPVERFKRTVLTAMNLTPELAEADRRSLFNACTRAAHDGLLPDGSEGALVIFKNNKTGKKEVQWLPMMKGVIKKLRQSGEIASISARVVYQKEIDQGRFRFVIEGGEEKLHHEPILWGDRGEPVLAYASARLKDGTVQHEPMTKSDILKAKAVSRSGNSEYGPWNKWPDEMWRKTPLKRLAKYLPLSAEDRRMIEEDDSTEFEEMKQDAIAHAQPQSLAAAAMLGGPAEPDHDADTGEVIEAETVTETETQTEEA